VYRELVATLREQLERAQADADLARVALAEARDGWEERLDRLAAEVAEERRGRSAAEDAKQVCLVWPTEAAGDSLRRSG
jgi:hypothetical protein